MPQDGIGNEINEGDMVRVALQDASAIGKVVKINVGGVSLLGPKNTGMTPGVLEIVTVIPVWFNPKNPTCPQILVLRDPKSQALIDKAMEAIHKGEAAPPVPTAIDHKKAGA